MTSEFIVDIDGPIMVLTINRPEVRNAVDHRTAERMSAALDELDRRSDIRVGVLTGAGGTFCAGMDLKAFVRGERPIAARGFAGIVERPPTKPLIAAVEGHALAGGFEVALACDLVVAAADAQFGLPEVRRGLVPAAGGMLHLPRRIPLAVANELVLVGRPITAERALVVGLVNAVVPAGKTLVTALEWARTIADNAPLAVQVAKRVLTETLDWPQDEAFARQQPLVAPILTSDDAKEGARAFAERREPIWHGR